ncbi:FecR domain-containing protein [Nemorincola caseinilytica]|uniref:FecR domain-containing protein n=1 Tax=Nemorincola caseinilytica TaxID=2054315 RepID=A0ABP8N771_9BACT
MNNKQQNMSDDVLVKHLLGEATPEERQEVQQWIAASADNRRYYEHFKLIWDESKKLDAPLNVDTDAAWGRFMQRVEREEQQATIAPPASPGPSRTIPLWSPRSLMRVAAMLVLMVGAGWLIYSITGTGDQVTLASADKVMKHTLPDGTVVTLNRNSTLSYPGAFTGETRNVTLSGEAFFDVTPDKTKPFIIDAGNSSVTVVGTSFNVKTRKDITEVIVESGIVEVAKKQKAVRLNPGQKATVTSASDAPVMEQTTDDLYRYYRTNEFVCNGIALYKVVNILNEAYNVHIEIADPKLASLPIHTTLHTNDLGQNLDVIKETFKDVLYLEQNGNSIKFRAR